MLKHKSQVFKCFQEWKSMVERSTGHRLITLCSDNGSEYTYLSRVPVLPKK